MDVQLGHELLEELGSTLENLETQQSALLQCLKDKGVVSDEQLAPYLTQASNASNVRWRAARLRLERILSGAQQKEEEEIKKRQESSAVGAQSHPEDETSKPPSAGKADNKAADQKKAEEQHTETAKSNEQKPESSESREAKTAEEAKPSAKEDTQPSEDRGKEAA